MRIQRAERLVHQEQSGVVEQCPADRDALAHAAGQLPWVVFLEACEPGSGQQLDRFRQKHFPIEMADVDLEQDVVEHRAPLEQCIPLKDDAQIRCKGASPFWSR